MGLKFKAFVLHFVVLIRRFPLLNEVL